MIVMKDPLIDQSQLLSNSRGSFTATQRPTSLSSVQIISYDTQHCLQLGRLTIQAETFPLVQRFFSAPVNTTIYN